MSNKILERTINWPGQQASSYAEQEQHHVGPVAADKSFNEQHLTGCEQRQQQLVTY